MSAWYEKAVFYHIYPLGLLGAPKENHRKEKQEPADAVDLPYAEAWLYRSLHWPSV